MNILIPDQWLRKYLTTKATPSQLKEYLSLCGPSIERIYGSGKDTVYDVEITGNRPDAMSVTGIAREAATILPRFGVPATMTGDPYRNPVHKPSVKKGLPLTIKTEATLNPRWTSVIFDHVKVGKSPAWLAKWLELAGMRSINNVIDITNFLMHAYGQPAHVFDYDTIEGHTMILRPSRKGETLVTLDGKTHHLPGDDIIIEDGSGKLIDLCGIMGGQNSAVTISTTRVILFLQTYDPSHIRRTSMALAHRTAAAGLFEKGTDPELVMPVFVEGIRMTTELTGAKIASTITDIYPTPYKPYTVTVKRTKVASYIGTISDREMSDILTRLGFAVTLTPTEVRVAVPSFRRDILIDVDIIEEIARIYGYHTIPPKLPEREPPMTIPDTQLTWEQELKIRLRDWGYTELYTYSMISEKQMEVFGLDKTKTYKLANPLSEEWVYLRPSLLPSMLATLKQNLHLRDNLALFELSMIYRFQKGNIPEERPTLLVALTGKKFLELKGLAETLFHLMGVTIEKEGECKEDFSWYNSHHLDFDDLGIVAEVNATLLDTLGIRQSVTILEIDLSKAVRLAKPTGSFVGIPKYPPVVEDLSFVVPQGFAIGPFMTALKNVDPKVAQVSLLSVYQDVRTVHVAYMDPTKNLTNEAIIPLHNKVIALAEKKFGAKLKLT